MDLKSFVEGKINHYAEMITAGKDKADDLAIGELQFYIALRRIINEKGSAQDIGMMDAINDVLQELRLVEKGKTFYKS